MSADFKSRMLDRTPGEVFPTPVGGVLFLNRFGALLTDVIATAARPSAGCRRLRRASGYLQPQTEDGA